METTCGGSSMSDFECPRCGHCCQALETEQEPVAWLKTWSDGSLSVLKTKSHAFADHELEPLYTTPPKREWVGLTLNEAEDFYEKYTDRAELINAIDKFLEEKNHG